MEDVDDVCVVTQPVADASAPHVEALLQILGTLTSVSLITANLPEHSRIREDYEILDVVRAGTGASIPVAAFRFVRNQFLMARILWSREESIVLFYGATSYLLPILVAKLSGKTVVIEPRGDVPLTLRLQWEERIPSPLARLLAGFVRLLEDIGYYFSDGIIAYTPGMATELDLYRFENKLYPTGARYVNTTDFSPRVAYEDRELVVGFLGRLDEEKRIRELAGAAKMLPNEVTFVFAGDGELRDWLEAELSEEIENGSVELTGWVEYEDVPVVLNRLKLLVLPSEPTEGLPTVILESLACGTPVLATPVSGVPDVVRPGETGFLLAREDPQYIASEIQASLSRHDLPEFSRQGRELMTEEYTLEAATERYSEILSQLSKKNGQAKR